MKAYIFPGQGAQYMGMGKDIHDQCPSARLLFEKANDILGFDITQIIFTGSEAELKQTKITQPAIFIHSVAATQCLADFSPEMVAGHSLGEFSALTVAKALSFEEGLKLVSQRAHAMQEACVMQPSSMSAVIGLHEEKVEELCKNIDDLVVAANYNCPGQVVISGEKSAVVEVEKLCKKAGARLVISLPVRGAFHSVLMKPASEKLNTAIDNAVFSKPICPIYQNVNAKPYTEIATIKQNLKNQLTAPVRWMQSIRNMIDDGAKEFVECGPGRTLRGLLKKIDSSVPCTNA